MFIRLNAHGATVAAVQGATINAITLFLQPMTRTHTCISRRTVINKLMTVVPVDDNALCTGCSLMPIFMRNSGSLMLPDAVKADALVAMVSWRLWCWLLVQCSLLHESIDDYNNYDCHPLTAMGQVTYILVHWLSRCLLYRPIVARTWYFHTTLSERTVTVYRLAQKVVIKKYLIRLNCTKMTAVHYKLKLMH